MKRLIGMLLLVLPALSGGCNYLAFVFHLFAPDIRTKVDAEYPDLENHSVAVVIWADQKTQCDHPLAQLETASIVAWELKTKIKNVRTIDPRRIAKYQDENIYWADKDKTALGKLFDADYVLYIVLSEFETIEPGSLMLFRGRITAEATLYKTSLPEGEAKVWGRQEFRVTYPAGSATGLSETTEERVRQGAESGVAEMLVKKFYKHEERAER